MRLLEMKRIRCHAGEQLKTAMKLFGHGRIRVFQVHPSLNQLSKINAVYGKTVTINQLEISLGDTYFGR